MKNFVIKPLTGALGAEVLEINLDSTLADDLITCIHTALIKHGVLVFRDQTLTTQQLKSFASQLGRLFVHPNFLSQRDPEIVEVRREPGDTRFVGEDWHSDTTMMPVPPKFGILYAVEVPPYGADTLFANQFLAWDTLSPGMQNLLKTLKAIHSDIKVAGPHARKTFNATRSTQLRDAVSWTETRTAHPVVCRLPENGRPYLFVNASYTIKFEDMAVEESEPLLQFLLSHGNRPEFTCRVRWRPGTLVLCDNRTTKHLAINDVPNYPRILRRIQIAGEIAPLSYE